VQVDFVARNMIAPLIDRQVSIIEIKSSVEHAWVEGIQRQLQGSVFQAGCSNWYINEHGHNAASWPGYASTFWKETCIPRFGIFNKRGGSYLWFLRTLSRWVRTTSKKTYGLGLLLLALGMWRKDRDFRTALQGTWTELSTRIGKVALRRE
jgi:hypothetical protein